MINENEIKYLCSKIVEKYGNDFTLSVPKKYYRRGRLDLFLRDARDLNNKN